MQNFCPCAWKGAARIPGRYQDASGGYIRSNGQSAKEFWPNSATQKKSERKVLPGRRNSAVPERFFRRIRSFFTELCCKQQEKRQKYNFGELHKSLLGKNLRYFVIGLDKRHNI